MKKTKFALLLLIPTVLVISFKSTLLAHDGSHGAASQESSSDFAADGMSCRWVGGKGQGLECEGPGGNNGFSTTCNLRPDLCKAGLEVPPKKEGPPKPPPKPSQGQKILPAGQGSPQQSQGAGAFKTKDGFVCEKIGEQGLECGKYASDGSPIEGFSTTCDLRPDLCREANPDSTVPNQENVAINDPSHGGPSIGIENLHQPPENSAIQNKVQAGAGINNGLTKPPLPDPSTQNNAQVIGNALGFEQDGKGGNVLSNDFWMNRSDEELTGANSRIDQLIAAARAGAALPMSALRRIRANIKHAFFHNITRTQVIKRLPPKYYAQIGVFEKPKTLGAEMDLVAEGAYDALVRDVSIGEECLGLTPGAASVRHVDMIAQCGQLPFGERRRFKF